PSERRGGRSRGTIAAIVAGVVVLAAAGGIAAATFLGGSGDKSKPAPNTVAQPSNGGATGSAAAGGGGGKAAPIDRRALSVAVLNGTTVTGLARNASDKIVAKGYKEGAVGTDSTNQQRQTTQVLYNGNQRPAALDVAKILGVRPSAVAKMDANARLLANNAQIAVFVGADKAQ
ncbi:MAG: LytR C-terminal domain-containing protein, partial [Actinomycetota bacterium]|nr:LytR C-terminal domain-containing protein [Actinomycetota bacterium]